MRDWELVNENISACLYRGDNIEKENEIHGVLSLSYEDLPHYLKPCFLYMGQFREDEVVSVNTLYRLWIAEGMISDDNRREDQTLMDIAELYLSELASRCIVQVQVVDAVKGQKYRSCKLHDVVRELCLSMRKKADFGLQILDNQGGNFGNLLLHESLAGAKTRRLSIYFHREPELESGECRIIHEGSSKHVRSLQSLNCIHGKKIQFPDPIIDFQKFKLLKVLVLVGFSFAGRKLPTGICNLIHLRYLCLRACELDELPSSISNLAYLYTLDLLDTWNVRVPNVLKKMHRLKHFLLPFYDTGKIENYRLRLDEGLDELETLFGFNSSVHELKSVTRMKNLRRFAATICDNESLSATINAITSIWKDLQYCTITIKCGCQFTSVEDGLTNLKKIFTCPNLHDLVINHVQVGKLLEECRNQIINSKLVRLYLSGCEIEDDAMEILGKLPLLEELRLSKRSFVGDEMKCHALGFTHLKKLVLKDLPNLREWKVEQGAMLILSEIEINSCSRLKMVPDGLRFILTLQKLTISGMSELGKQVSEGKDFDKVRHVPSIIIW